MRGKPPIHIHPAAPPPFMKRPQTEWTQHQTRRQTNRQGRGLGGETACMSAALLAIPAVWTPPLLILPRIGSIRPRWSYGLQNQKIKNAVFDPLTLQGSVPAKEKRYETS